MSIALLNLLSSILALIGGLLWLLLGDSISALVWIAVSLVWLALALRHLVVRNSEPVSSGALWRRISKLLLYG